MDASAALDWGLPLTLLLDQLVTTDTSATTAPYRTSESWPNSSPPPPFPRVMPRRGRSPPRVEVIEKSHPASYGSVSKCQLCHGVTILLNSDFETSLAIQKSWSGCYVQPNFERSHRIQAGVKRDEPSLSLWRVSSSKHHAERKERELMGMCSASALGLSR